MPELIITINSANKGATDLIIGNAIGSNICNLLFILATTAMLRPIKLEKDVKFIHLPVAFFSGLVILSMGLGLLGSENGIISRVDGKVLILFYLIYFIYPVIIEIKDIWNAEKESQKKHQKSKYNISLCLLYIVFGVILLKIGGDLVVDKSSEIATIFGLSERIIGLTIVAIGTALPEMLTSIVAVIKKEEGLAVGNLIGSCILNSFLALGVGAIISPLTWSSEFNNDLILLLIATLFIWLSSFIGRKNTLTRTKSSVLLLMFFYYLYNLFL